MSRLVDRLAGIVVLVELAALGIALWRLLDPDAPELDELARDYFAEAREHAQNREAVRRVLASIRNLPETEGGGE